MTVTDEGPRERVRARASVASRVATLLLVAIAWAAVDQAAGSPELRQFASKGWLALAAGSLVAGITPVGRLFRRVSVWPVAALIAGAATALAFDSGSTTMSTWSTIWVLSAFVLGLDLCWVSRLRVWVFVSGVFLIPALVVGGGGSVAWAAGWLVAAFATLWLLSADVHSRMTRAGEETDTGTRQRRPRDLGRIVVLAVSIGVVGGLVLDSPGFAFRPLERLVRYLPFKPELDLSLDTDLDIRDYEVDANGHEVRYRVTPDGQRFVTDPSTHEPLAVVQVDGSDRFLTVTGEVVAIVHDGASRLEVPDGNGNTTTYQRDDTGWYVWIGDRQFRPVLRWGSVELVASDGSWAPEDVVSSVVLPPAAVLDGTVGENTRVWRYGDMIEIDGWRSGHRSYRLFTDGLEVDVRRRDGRYEYSWDADRSTMTVHVEKLGQSGSLDIDRTGNAFDYLRSVLAEQADDSDGGATGRSWRDHLRTVGMTFVLLGAVAVAVEALRRRTRRADGGDRTWAEETVGRLEEEGARHEIVREPSESVVAYLTRLALVLDDGNPRLLDSAEILDRALYGSMPLSRSEHATVDAAVEAFLDRDRSSVRCVDGSDQDDRGSQTTTGISRSVLR
ncbi:MAG: hypothetical protein KDB02_02560 [Acidimicrobiales bacterium]|nr:hypothetical protein [Acidimicrobiales bacterium]